MKTYIPYSLLLAAASCGLAHGAATAYTTPVGYETVTLAPNQYNLIGVRLFNPSVAAGVFDSSTSTTLVDNEASFSLTPTKSYIIEFSTGATITLLGSNFSTTTVSGLTGITAAYQTSYIVRESSTVSSVFGATNQAGLASSANADPTEADIILIPNGANYTRVFYSTFTGDPLYTGWLDADSFAKVPNEVIEPSEGLFVQTAISASPINLVVSGEIKKTPTAYQATNPYSLMGSVYPAGATLTTSGLSSYVQPSVNADPTEADNILLPNGSGGYVRAFFSTFTGDPLYTGWLDSDSFAKIPNQSLTPGFFIQKIGPNISGLNSAPSTYSSL